MFSISFYVINTLRIYNKRIKIVMIYLGDLESIYTSCTLNLIVLPKWSKVFCF